jgi:hypothetical protein
MSHYPEQFFYNACKTGDMEAIKIYSSSKKIFQYHALAIACENGQLKAAQWLSRHYDFSTIGKKQMLHSFIFACKNGHFEMATWLHSNYKFTADDARADDNFALRWACDRGHFRIVKWLVRTFDLTIDDIRTENNFALYWACHHGHFDIVQWLVTHFGMTQEDIGEEYKDKFIFVWRPPRSAAINIK